FYGYLIPYIVIISSVLYMLKKLDLKEKLNSILSINLSIITLIHIIYLNNDKITFLENLKISIEFGKLGEGGGIIGGILSFLSLTLFGNVGSFILLISIILTSILVLTNQSLFKIL